MKLNDIYRWSYTDEKMAESLKFWSQSYLVYWATSRICICKQNADGSLYLEDTWSPCGDNKRLEPSDVILEYLGNFDELDKFTGDINHFNPSDIVDISHSNLFGNHIYIKKGAKKCLETVRAHIKREIEEKEYKAKSAAEDVIRYKKVLDELTEDNLDKVWI